MLTVEFSSCNEERQENLLGYIADLLIKEYDFEQDVHSGNGIDCVVLINVAYDEVVTIFLY